MSATPGETIPGCIAAEDGECSTTGRLISGLCNTHYGRFRRHGSCERRNRRNPKVCTVDDGECSKPGGPIVKGLCARHYRRHSSQANPPCSVEKCSARSIGPEVRLCGKHYQRLRNTGSLLDPVSSLSRDDTGRKRCATCRDWLPESAYGVDNSRRDGLQVACKSCLRARYLRATYGLSKDELGAMLASQEGRCQICGDDFGSRYHVDHDHHDGHVRGLLCGTCNPGLGQFRDNPEILRAAAAYLEADRDRRLKGLE